MRALIIVTAIATLAIAGGCNDTTGAAAAPAQPVNVVTETAARPAARPQAQPPKEPPVRLEPAVITFGDVPVATSHPGTFTLHNEGAVPLRIRKASPSCKCTTTEDLVGRVIPPGESTTMTATLTTSTTPGPKEANLYIFFEGYRKALTAKISALAVMEIEAEPPYVDSLDDKATGLPKTTGQLQVRSRDGRPFRILSSNGEAPAYVGYDPDRDPPRNAYTVAWSTEGWACEGMRLWWVLETDRPECPVLPARIRHECSGAKADPNRRERAWFFKEYLVQTGAIRAGSPIELELFLDRLGDKTISAIESAHPDCFAELIDVQPTADGYHRCRFTFTPGANLRGTLYANLKISSPTGDGILPLVGKVVDP